MLKKWLAVSIKIALKLRYKSDIVLTEHIRYCIINWVGNLKEENPALIGH